MKNYSLIREEANKKQAQAEVLKNKINGFLINYFNYLVFSLGVIILIVGLFALVYPKYQQISKANQEAKNSLQIKYETKLNYLNFIRNLKKSYESISNDGKAKIAAMVPAGRDTSTIIKEVESIVAKNNAILLSIKIEPQTIDSKINLRVESREDKEPPAGIFNQPPQGVGLVKLEISMGSVNYPVLKNIIKTFENNLKLFDIAKISFNAKDNTALLNIYSYYLK